MVLMALGDKGKKMGSLLSLKTEVRFKQARRFSLPSFQLLTINFDPNILNRKF
jgi:hypothetical protein